MKNPNRMLKNTRPSSLLLSAASMTLGGKMPSRMSTSLPLPEPTVLETSCSDAARASSSRAGTPSTIPGRTMFNKVRATSTAISVVRT